MTTVAGLLRSLHTYTQGRKLRPTAASKLGSG
uniref:Sulfite oxidase n=1 Tax=Molossus molossus TaxID=27622 RepID=A0A7J8G1U6_MOLMO|nr:sulfite oxidase [Molossus molossus]